MLGLGAFSPAFSADWTNFLKGIQNGCETYTLREKLQKKTSIPKALQANISKYTTKAGADGQKSVDIRLKNATAFGKPINVLSWTIANGAISLWMFILLMVILPTSNPNLPLPSMVKNIVLASKKHGQ